MVKNLLKSLRYLLFVGIISVGLVTIIGCSGGGGDSDGGDSWCPGTICNNCATDCPDLDCPAGQYDTCVGGEYFDADENLRCSFCQ